jgi:hypothetical protein
MGTSLAISAAGAGAQYIGQSQAASASKDYQKAQIRQREALMQENYNRAIEAYRLNLVAEQARMDEVRKAATVQKFNINQRGLEARSSAAAEAASRGSAGQSQFINLLSYLTRAGQGNTAITRQFRAEVDQSNRNREAYRIQARDRITSIQPFIPSPISRPSPVAAFLQIGEGAISAYNTFKAPYDQAERLTAGSSGSSVNDAPALGLR